MRWILALLLAWPLTVLGADGGDWGAYVAVNRGELDCIGFLLCDGKVAADSTCDEFDLSAPTTGRGWPAFFTVTITTIDPQCSGTPEFQARGLHTTGGATSDWGPQLTEAGLDSFDYKPKFKFLDVSLTDDAACDAPGNTVVAVLCYER
jgi:hypothetical protein